MDTLSIGEYLAEVKPKAGLLPADRLARAHCRSICGEMHSGFYNLRSALPMNVRARYQGFKTWAGALPDIERVTEIWGECLALYGGPFLFGAKPTMADAMYAPVCSRFTTYRRRPRRPLRRLRRDHPRPGHRWPNGSPRRRPSPRRWTSSDVEF